MTTMVKIMFSSSLIVAVLITSTVSTPRRQHFDFFSSLGGGIFSGSRTNPSSKAVTGRSTPAPPEDSTSSTYPADFPTYSPDAVKSRPVAKTQASGLFNSMSQSASASNAASKGQFNPMDINTWDSIPAAFFAPSVPAVGGEAGKDGAGSKSNPISFSEAGAEPSLAWDYSSVGLGTGAEISSSNSQDVFLPLADHPPGSIVADQPVQISDWSVPPVGKDTAKYRDEPTTRPQLRRFSDGESMAKAILSGQVKKWEWTYSTTLGGGLLSSGRGDRNDQSITCCQRLPYICGVDGMCVIGIDECKDFCVCAANPEMPHCITIIPVIKRTMVELEKKILAKVAKQLNMTTPPTTKPVTSDFRIPPVRETVKHTTIEELMLMAMEMPTRKPTSVTPPPLLRAQSGRSPFMHPPNTPAPQRASLASQRPFSDTEYLANSKPAPQTTRTLGATTGPQSQETAAAAKPKNMLATPAPASVRTFMNSPRTVSNIPLSKPADVISHIQTDTHSSVPTRSPQSSIDRLQTTHTPTTSSTESSKLSSAVDEDTRGTTKYSLSSTTTLKPRSDSPITLNNIQHQDITKLNKVHSTIATTVPVAASGSTDATNITRQNIHTADKTGGNINVSNIEPASLFDETKTKVVNGANINTGLEKDKHVEEISGTTESNKTVQIMDNAVYASNSSKRASINEHLDVTYGTYLDTTTISGVIMRTVEDTTTESGNTKTDTDKVEKNRVIYYTTMPTKEVSTNSTLTAVYGNNFTEASPQRYTDVSDSRKMARAGASNSSTERTTTSAAVTAADSRTEQMPTSSARPVDLPQSKQPSSSTDDRLPLKSGYMHNTDTSVSNSLPNSTDTSVSNSLPNSTDTSVSNSSPNSTDTSVSNALPSSTIYMTLGTETSGTAKIGPETTSMATTRIETSYNATREKDSDGATVVNEGNGTVLVHKGSNGTAVDKETNGTVVIDKEINGVVTAAKESNDTVVVSKEINGTANIVKDTNETPKLETETIGIETIDAATTSTKTSPTAAPTTDTTSKSTVNTETNGTRTSGTTAVVKETSGTVKIVTDIYGTTTTAATETTSTTDAATETTNIVTSGTSTVTSETTSIEKKVPEIATGEEIVAPNIFEESTTIAYTARTMSYPASLNATTSGASITATATTPIHFQFPPILVSPQSLADQHHSTGSPNTEPTTGLLTADVGTVSRQEHHFGHSLTTGAVPGTLEIENVSDLVASGQDETTPPWVEEKGKWNGTLSWNATSMNGTILTYQPGTLTSPSYTEDLNMCSNDCVLDMGGVCVVGNDLKAHCVVVREACDQLLCINGYCVSTDGVQVCECRHGWVGAFCEKACHLDCGDHSFCAANEDSKNVTCACRWNYTGQRCESPRKIVPVIFDLPEPSDGLRTWEVAVVAVVTAIILALMCVLSPYLLWKNQWLPMRKFVFYFWPYEDNDDREFDAFVSYISSPRDERFVLHHLYPKLERELDFRLCLPFRDFIPGEPLAKNLVRSIQKSRRVILILSPSYVSSEWCRDEYQKAQLELLKIRSKVISVVLEDNIDMPEMDNTLKKVTDNYNKFRWPGEEKSSSSSTTATFWKLLELAMPKRNRDYCSYVSCSGIYSNDFPVTPLSRSSFNSITWSLTEEDIFASSVRKEGSSSTDSGNCSDKTLPFRKPKQSSLGQLHFPEMPWSQLGVNCTKPLKSPQESPSSVTGSVDTGIELSAKSSSASSSIYRRSSVGSPSNVLLPNSMAPHPTDTLNGQLNVTAEMKTDHHPLNEGHIVEIYEHVSRPGGALFAPAPRKFPI